MTVRSALALPPQELERADLVTFPVQRVLDLARTQLGMDVAWLSTFTDGQQVITAASGDLSAMGLDVGSGADLAESYCIRVVSGTLPAVIPDARRDLRTRDLQVTADLGIGAYVGSPLRDTAGDTVGMLCCLNRTPKPALDERASDLLASLVDLLGASAPSEYEAADGADQRCTRDTLRRLHDRELRPVFQPIHDLATGRPVGYEALARFDGPPATSPAHAFADARQAGLGVELELLSLQQTFLRLAEVPTNAWLSVNCSPDAVLDDRVGELLTAQPAGRIVIELTEHVPVSDYDELTARLGDYRDHGVRLGIDDAGAGYSSLRHILRLRPDFIKLDIYLTHGIDADPVRQTLTTSLVTFADSLGAAIVAEGIEQDPELQTLTSLGVPLGQGYHLGRPGPLPCGPVQ